MGADAGDKGREIAKGALEHSWDWFALYAGQRMQLVNFFLVAVAFLAAAFVTALTQNRYALAIATGMLRHVDRLHVQSPGTPNERAGEGWRSRSEAAQRRLAQEAGIRELELLERVEKPERGWTSYGTIIATLHWATFFAFLLGSLYALYLTGVRLCFRRSPWRRAFQRSNRLYLLSGRENVDARGGLYNP